VLGGGVLYLDMIFCCIATGWFGVRGVGLVGCEYACMW
jgi:hypothetical protein